MKLIREEEIEIQKRLNVGDVTALELLFHRYYNDLCRYLIIFLKDEHVAKNIVQDLFMYLWENHRRIDLKKTLESYLGKWHKLHAMV